MRTPHPINNCSGNVPYSWPVSKIICAMSLSLLYSKPYRARRFERSWGSDTSDIFQFVCHIFITDGVSVFCAAVPELWDKFQFGSTALSPPVKTLLANPVLTTSCDGTASGWSIATLRLSSTCLSRRISISEAAFMRFSLSCVATHDVSRTLAATIQILAAIAIPSAGSRRARLILTKRVDRIPMANIVVNSEFSRRCWPDEAISSRNTAPSSQNSEQVRAAAAKGGRRRVWGPDGWTWPLIQGSAGNGSDVLGLVWCQSA